MYFLEHLTHKRLMNLKIIDEHGRPVYLIKESSALFTKIASMKDQYRNEVAKIRQIPGITPAYIISSQEAEFKVVQKFSLKPRFVIKNSAYEIKGLIYDTDYEVMWRDHAVLHCWREMHKGKYIQKIDILEHKYEIEALAIVITVESSKRSLFMTRV